MEKKKLGYYKKGNRVSKLAFKNNVWLYFKFVIFTIASVIAKLTIVLYPLAKLAGFRVANDLINNNDFSMDSILKDAGDKKQSRTLLILYSVKVLTIIAGLVLFSIIAAAFAYLGYLIDIRSSLPIFIIGPLMAVPAVVAFIIFGFAVSIYMEFAIYIAATTKDIKVSEAVSESFKLYDKGNIKRLINTYLINIALFVATLTIGLIISIFAISEFDELVSLIVILIIVFVALAIIIRLSVALRVSIVSLYDAMFENKSDKLYSLNVDLEEEKAKTLIDLFETNKSEAL